MDFEISYLNLGQSKVKFLPVLFKHSGCHKNKQPRPLLALTRWPSMLMTLLHQSLHHENQRNWLTKNWKPQRRSLQKRTGQLTEEITSLISLQESSFSDVSKAKVLEVQKQLHKEEKKNYKKNQRGAVYQRQLREKRIDGIQKLCKKESGAA